MQINIEKGRTMFFATSPEVKGLLVGNRTLAGCIAAIPECLKSLEAAKPGTVQDLNA